MKRRSLLAFLAALPFWRPDRLEAAMQEMRFALRDPDQMRNMIAIQRLRELTGSEHEWRLAVGRSMSLAMVDGSLRGIGDYIT